MNCTIIKERIADYLTGDVDEATQKEIQSHIADCPGCREELESLSAVWAKLGVVPQEQPSPELRGRFYTMLQEYKRDHERNSVRTPESKAGSRRALRFGLRRPAFSFGFSLLLLVLGLAAGYYLTTGRQNGGQISRLNQEVQDMRQMVAISLLSQPSTTARLEGVSWSSQVQNPDQKTLQALFETLNSDPNTNVRLAAVDALYLFRARPQVMDNLIQSLSRQTSPLVQVALIDLLVEIRERRAADALRLLIQNKKLNPSVKEHAELGLKQLI